jgi:hypothetical protein
MSHQNVVRACMSARRLSAVIATAVFMAVAVVFSTSADAASTETPGETFPVSVTPGGEYANGEGAGEYRPVSISADGRYVAFESAATNLGAQGPAGAYEGFVKDLSTGAVTLVSRADGVGGAPAGEPGIEDLELSADGRYVLFTSTATNLGTPLPGEEPSEQHVYRRDLETGETILVDRVSGAAGAIFSREARAGGISSNGRYVVFAANVANLEAPAGNHAETAIANHYVRDTVAGTTTAVSRATGVAGALADEPSEAVTVSADGRYVAFASDADNLVAGVGGPSQVYLRDLQNATTTLVSQNALGDPGDRSSYLGTLAGDRGCEVQFSSLAFNLMEPSPLPIAGEQVYIADLCSSAPTMKLVSQKEGELAGGANGAWAASGTSADGHLVLLWGSFSLSGAYHLFLKDLDSDEVSQVDRASGSSGVSSDAEPEQAAIAGNGCRVAFGSRATNLHPSGPPAAGAGEFQVYVRQLGPCVTPEPPENPVVTDQPAAANTAQPAPAGPADLEIAGLDRRRIVLDLSGPGSVTVRIRRLQKEPRRHWKFLGAVVASSESAARVELPLPALSPGRYRLNVHLDQSRAPGTVRLLTVGGPR